MPRLPDGRFQIEFFDVDYEQLHNYELPDDIRRVINTVNRKVAANESLDDVMNFLYESTIEICPCHRIGLAFVIEEGKRVLSRWSRATYDELYLHDGFIEDLHITTRYGVVDKLRVRLVHDFEAYAELNPDIESTQLLLKEGIKSSMTSPLVSDGEVIGMLMRHSREPAAFSQQHVYQHLATAEQLTQAVVNALRIEEMDKLNKSYMEMLGFVSHELKSPLASVNMTAQLLLNGYLGDITEKQRGKIESIKAKVDYLSGLVREYLDLARLEGGELEAHPVKGVDFIKEVMGHSLDVVESQIEESGMTLAWERPDGMERVEMDSDLMNIVVVNLLSNAVKYGNQGSRIAVVTRLEDGHLFVSIENEGPGFPEEQKQRLFQKFSRLQTEELRSRKGTGVGLYTCWRIIRLHGGRIWAESEHGRWARFSFEIPQPLQSVEEPEELL